MAEAAQQMDLEDKLIAKPRKRGEVVKIEPVKQEVAPVPQSDTAAILSLVERILTDPSVSVERANQALDFALKLRTEQARTAYSAAMADSKTKFEPIVKRRLVEYGEGKNKTSYKHEDLADISEVVDPILAEHGLFTRYRATSNPNEPIRVTCIVEHRAGHFEETTLSAPSDNSGGKNPLQSIGSTLSYLQRYTKRLALGLAPARDDDGKAAGVQEALTDEQVTMLFDLITETNSNIDQFLIAAKVAPFDEADERTLETVNAKLREVKPSEFDRLLKLLNAKKRKAVKS